MAYTFDVNNTPATGAVALYLLKEALKAAGWTVMASSDGTTYNSGGDQISSGGSGAGGMANNYAWFRIRMPTQDSVTRELSIQRITTNYGWRIKYSQSAGFTGAPGGGGSIDATHVGSATDEKVLAGGGTDASPTATTVLSTTDGSYRYNIAAGGSAEDYAWYAFAFPNGGGNPNSLFFMDRMASGTYPSADVEPYVMTFTTSSPSITTLTSTTSVVKGYLAKGMASEGFVSLPACVPADDGAAVTGALGTNPHTGNDDLLPMAYARRSAIGSPSGWKGIGSMMKYTGVTRTTGSAMTVSSTRDRVVAQDVSLPWDGSTPII